MIDLRQPWDSAFKRPDRRPIYEWASERIIMPPSWTRPFNIQSSRHFVEPFDMLIDETIRELNIMAPVQSGKSLISEVAACYWRANNPGPHLWLFQDDDIAKEYAEARGMPLLKSIPEIRLQLSALRSQTRTQEIIFLDGTRLVIWGPALNNLQTFGYRYVTCDELWKWNPGVLKEAKGRLSAYAKMGLDKLLCLSQGGMAGDDWDNQFQSGEVRLWHVKCESCGHMMYPHFSAFREDGSRWGIKFDAIRLEDKPDHHDVDRAAATSRFECEKCGHLHDNSPRTRGNWNLTGEYRTEGPAIARRKSYRWPVWIDSDWGTFVKEFLEAKAVLKDDPANMIVFVQKRRAEPASDGNIYEHKMQFAKADITLESCANDTLRIMSVDRQKEGTYWVSVRSWRKDPCESRRLLFRFCTSESELVAIAEEFKISTIKIRGDMNRWERIVKAVFIDARFDTRGDDGVYRMCAEHGWCAVMGDKRRSFVHSWPKKRASGSVEVVRQERPYSDWRIVDPGQGTTSAGRKTAVRAFISSNIFRDRLQTAIERGSWIEPTHGPDPELEKIYETQMKSSHREPKVDSFTKKVFMHWVCPSRNDHAQDLGKYQIFGATICEYL